MAKTAISKRAIQWRLEIAERELREGFSLLARAGVSPARAPEFRHAWILERRVWMDRNKEYDTEVNRG